MLLTRFATIRPLDPIKQSGEDPFIYYSKRGVHIVFHSFGENVGGYAVTTDPEHEPWRVVPHGIYNTTVALASTGGRPVE